MEGGIEEGGHKIPKRHAKKIKYDLLPTAAKRTKNKEQ